MWGFLIYLLGGWGLLIGGILYTFVALTNSLFGLFSLPILMTGVLILRHYKKNSHRISKNYKWISVILFVIGGILAGIALWSAGDDGLGPLAMIVVGTIVIVLYKFSSDGDSPQIQNDNLGPYSSYEAKMADEQQSNFMAHGQNPVTGQPDERYR